MKTNWLWDTKLKEGRVREILKDDHDPRFFIYAAKLLARSHDPREAFSWVPREMFDQNWRMIRTRMVKDAWSRTAVARWDRFQKRAIPQERFEVAGQIKEAKKALGLSQAQFAQKMGVIQQYVSNLEAGSENITLDTLRKIAGVLNKKAVIRFV